jgi:hypothetical protein
MKNLVGAAIAQEQHVHVSLEELAATGSIQFLSFREAAPSMVSRPPFQPSARRLCLHPLLGILPPLRNEPASE